MFDLGLIGNLLKPNYPIATFLDSANDATDLTTYTFSNMKLRIPFNNFSIASEAAGTGPLIRSMDKAVIVAAIHSEDALGTFDISSCTLGAVAGTEVADQGGAGFAISSAFYLWECSALAGIANTDVVVTQSEAVTSCAVNLILVSNLMQTSSVGSGVGTSNGNIAITMTDITKPLMGNAILLFASSNDTQTSVPAFNPDSTSSAANGFAGFAPIILNEGSNAEFAWAVGYRTILQTDLCTANTDYSRSRYNWSTGSTTSQALMLLC